MYPPWRVLQHFISQLNLHFKFENWCDVSVAAIPARLLSVHASCTSLLALKLTMGVNEGTLLQPKVSCFDSVEMLNQ